MITISKVNHLIEHLSYHYDKYSLSDKNICTFFLKNKSTDNLTIDFVAKKCNVSKASLTRFAKKSGFSGYKEFIILYKQSLNDLNNTRKYSSMDVLHTMQTSFLDHLYENFENFDFKNFCSHLLSSKKLFIFGFGKADLVAQIYSTRLEEYNFQIHYSQYYEHLLYLLNDHLTNRDTVLIIYHHKTYSDQLAKIISISKKKKGNIIVLSLCNSFDEMNYAQSFKLFPSWENNVSKNTATMYFPFFAFLDIVTHEMNVINDKVIT